MPRRKGWKCSEQVKENMRKGALARESRIIERYGFTKDFYDQQISSGNCWCSTCKTFQVQDEFPRSGRRVRCRSCTRAYGAAHYAKNKVERNQKRKEYFFANRESELRKRRIRLLSKYGVSAEWYESALASQGGCCDICGGKSARLLSIDHDHKCCGEKRTACDKCRRGLLCTRCNNCLERLDTIPDWATKALAYLRKHGSLA